MAAFASKFTHIITIVIGTSAVCVSECVSVCVVPVKLRLC